ncbi:MAG: alpha/beta fold hydrolase [Bauldia sp.]
MATFVLVHGAFHGAWCWVRLTPALEALGHRAVTLDLPSLGDDQTPIADVTLESWIERTVAVVEGEAEPVILVGHSMAGIVIAGAAELVPERIRLLVYLAAFLPRDGDSIRSLSASPAARQETGPPAFARSLDGLSFSAIAERAPAVLYSTSPAADIAHAMPKLRPQAYSVQRAPVALSEGRYGSVPRAYIECRGDNTVSLGLQRDMVAKAGVREVVSLATDHSPFFSAPELLAGELSRLASAG